jgi:hypothetical protein
MPFGPKTIGSTTADIRPVRRGGKKQEKKATET